MDLDKKGGGRVYWPVDGQASKGRVATEQVLGRARRQISSKSFLPG